MGCGATKIQPETPPKKSEAQAAADQEEHHKI